MRVQGLKCRRNGSPEVFVRESVRRQILDSGIRSFVGIFEGGVVPKYEPGRDHSRLAMILPVAEDECAVNRRAALTSGPVFVSVRSVYKTA